MKTWDHRFADKVGDGGDFKKWLGILVIGGMILKWGAWNNFTDHVLDEALSGEAMKLFVIDKIKKKLIFFHKNKKDIWFQRLDSCFAKH